MDARDAVASVGQALRAMFAGLRLGAHHTKKTKR
jgi:hypothetical protein